MPEKIASPSEHDEQVSVCQWLDARGVSYFAVPNGAQLGGANRYALLAKLKAEGLLPGAPDLVLINPAPRSGRPVVVEMKRTLGATLGREQKRVRGLLEASGWIYVLGRGAHDAIRRLELLGY